MGTHNLLEVTRLFCPTLERFIHCSTDEVYGESMLEVDEQHKTEQSVLCPTNPYAASKAAAEMLVQSYNHSFKMPIIITRGNNVYGPNQYPEKLIPLTIMKCLNKKKIPIYGTGKNIRDWLYVEDHCRGIDLIMNKGVRGETYNIGGNNEWSNIDVILTLCKIVNKKFTLLK